MLFGRAFGAPIIPFLAIVSFYSKLLLRKGKEDNITKILRLIAPGTPIRDGLENIERNKWTLKMKKNSNLKYKFEFFFSC